MALTTVKRVLSPNLNPTGLSAAAAAIYAAAVMIYNASHHHGTIDPQVIVAALAAAAFLYSRFLVTPTADPKNGAGVPLVPAPAPLTAAEQIMMGRLPLSPEDQARLPEHAVEPRPGSS